MAILANIRWRYFEATKYLLNVMAIQKEKKKKKPIRAVLASLFS